MFINNKFIPIQMGIETIRIYTHTNESLDAIMAG